MKKRELTYILFSAIGSLVVLLASLTLMIFSFSHNLTLSDYPKVDLTSYVNRSESHLYSDKAGTQLYEAESLMLAGNAKVEENIHASNQEIVSSLSTGATLALTFTSDSQSKAKLAFCTSYISQTNRSSRSSDLFRISLNSVNIPLSTSITPSYNEYDFIENDIAILNVVEGINQLTIVSYINIYTLDYLTLTSPDEKSDDSLTMKHHEEYFDASGMRQVFEAELQSDISGAVIIKNKAIETEFAVYFTNQGDNLSYHIFVDEESETSFAIRAKKEFENATSPGVDVTINKESISTKNLVSMKDTYDEIVLGTIHLLKGENVLSFNHLGGRYYLDSIILNCDINFASSSKQLCLEAEDGKLSGGCSSVIANSTKSKVAVGYNLANSSISYTLTCLKPSTAHIDLHLSYTGEKLPLNNVLSIQVNGYEISKMNKDIISPGEKSSYDSYFHFYGGQLSLSKGTNSFKIVSISGQYNLDCIYFFTQELTDDIDYQLIEVEDMLSDDSTLYYSEKASNRHYMKMSGKNSCLSFFVYLDSDRKIDLRIILSQNVSSNVFSDDLFTVNINQKIVELPLRKIEKTKSITAFESFDFGEVSFKAGLNYFELKSLNPTFFIDSLLLTL